MAVEMTGQYLGGLTVGIRHGPSGAEIRTAAPVDNNGDGSSFSPTDLVAAALGACMLTVMGIAAEREGAPSAGTSFTVAKHMRSDPRRIDALVLRVRMPAALSEEQRGRLERIATACPVHHSLLAEIRCDVEFAYVAL